MKEILSVAVDGMAYFATEIIVFGVTAGAAWLKRKLELRKLKRQGLLIDDKTRNDIYRLK